MNFITRNKKVRGGQLVLKGTRFPICRVIAELADGYTVDEIAQDLDLDILLVRNALNELARKFEEHEVFVL